MKTIFDTLDRLKESQARENLTIEFNTLNQNILNLSTRINDIKNKFETFDEEQTQAFDLLNEQIKAMKIYRDILQKRIDAGLILS